MTEQTKSTLESRNEDGTLDVKVTIEGKTDMPFWKHDLKIKAAISLLNTVDKKDFYEDGKEDEFEKYIDELQELINAIRF